MSKDFFDNDSHCCSIYNSYKKDSSDSGCSMFYFLVILFLFFGGGFGPGSFWGPYNQIYGCSGFNSDWCSNTGFTNLGANIPTPLNSLGLSNGYLEP